MPTPRTPAGSKPKDSTAKQRVQKHSHQVLRPLAERIFVYSDEAVPVREIAARPEFAGVAVGTLSQWSVADKWNDQRRAFLGRLRQKLEAHVSSTLVQQRKQQLATYQRLREQLTAYVLPDAQGHVHTAPKSAEACIAALLKVDEASERVRREIGDSLGQSLDGPPAPTPSDITPEAARRLAHLYLQDQMAAPPAADAQPAPAGAPDVLDAPPAP